MKRKQGKNTHELADDHVALENSLIASYNEVLVLRRVLYFSFKQVFVLLTYKPILCFFVFFLLTF